MNSEGILRQTVGSFYQRSDCRHTIITNMILAGTENGTTDLDNRIVAVKDTTYLDSIAVTHMEGGLFKLINIKHTVAIATETRQAYTLTVGFTSHSAGIVDKGLHTL